ncbi:MAG: hypothetical protein AAGB04_06015 [Pseudomonadota bacterium]
MFTIQTIMLVSLGFLLAALMGFIVAPAYWNRAVRLTTQRIRRSLPLTEAEIRAEQDRLRAQNAIRIHQLESSMDRVRRSAARQTIEINRRDATIGTLERETQQLNTKLEASENARRVLEQTIMDRVPRVEDRLSEARKLLFQRDREMAALQADTSKTFRALDEAMQINAQQRIEIDRMKSSLASSRGGRQSKGGNRAAQESETALRAELEVLRTRVRDQASLIGNLQELVADGNKSKLGATVGSSESEQATSEQVKKLDSGLENVQGIMKSLEETTPEAVSASASAMQTLREDNKELSDEIEKLKAALSVFEEPDDGAGSRSLRDSRIALKARVASLEKETTTQNETIRKLRAELAAANDRSARQAAHHMNEMRRLGAGSVPANLGAQERVASTKVVPERPSLADKITETVPSVSSDLARMPAATTAAPTSAPPEIVLPSDRTEKIPKPASQKVEQQPETVAVEAQADEAAESSGRGGLMQRIAGLGKS